MARNDDLLPCYTSFAFSDDAGNPVVIAEGSKFHADHPAVRAAPLFFHAERLPTDERPKMRDLIQEGITTSHRPIPDGFRRDAPGGRGGRSNG